MGVILLAAAQATLDLRGLYGDGAYYFWSELQAHGFYFYPSRVVAQFVTQLPVVTAMNFGVSDVSVLARLQSFGVAAIPMIMWVLAFYVLRRSWMFWPFVAMFAVTFLNSGFLSIGEYNFAYALVALCAAIMLVGTFGRWGLLGLVAASAMLPFSYESLAHLGPLLSVLVLIRLRGAFKSDLRDRLKITALFIALAMYVAATIISVVWIVFPRDATNLAGAADFSWPLFNDRQLVLSGALATVYILAACFGGPRIRRWAAIPLGLLSLILIDHAFWDEPWKAFGSRAVTGVALFVLLAVIVIGRLREERRARRGVVDERLPSWSWLPAILLLAVQLVPMTVHTAGWSGWLSQFKYVVDTSSGTHTNEETVLRFSNTSLYVWPWTNPFLSVDLASHNGAAIILSPNLKPGDQQIPAELPARYEKFATLF